MSYVLDYCTCGESCLSDPDDWSSPTEWYIPVWIDELDEDGEPDGVDFFDFIPSDWLSDWGDELDALLAAQGWRRTEPWPLYGENVEVGVERIAACDA